MEFIVFRNKLIEHFKELTKDSDYLFEVDVDKDVLWDLYLSSFPKGTNEIYRTRREHDCSCCRHFIKSVGNIVVLKDNKIKTIWDFDAESTTFQPVIDSLDNYIKQRTVSNVFVTKITKFGQNYSIENKENKMIQFDHFHLELPKKFKYNGYKSEDTVKGEFRDSKNVFKRSLDELSLEAIETVLELISQNSIYRGKEWENNLKTFKGLKIQYEELDNENEKNNFCWVNSLEVGNAIAKIRNHSIGTLLINITEGMDLDSAVKAYEKIVAPENYKRSKPVYTKRMLEDAKNTITEMGYIDSLERRFATIDDISVNNILFANKDSVNRIIIKDIFSEMESEVSINPKKFNKVEEINIEDFIKNVLPGAKEMEVLFENRLSKNLCSLIAPKIKESKSMFKWNNNYCWAYTGNITDSSLKENVKKAGGNVDGVLRFSIQWNDKYKYNQCDYDAHCKTPKEHIYFANKFDHYTGGRLDVDITHPEMGKPAVENIVWVDKKDFLKGNYVFYVHNYMARSGNYGFKAEIEFDGQIYQFEYDKPLRQDENVRVAEAHFNGSNFTIKELLPSNVSSKQIWNLNTNQFVPVNVMMYSPNYWDEQSGIGNKHYMFMLKDCVNPEEPNGFYVEYLQNELSKHRKVFEAMGSKLSVVSSENQLSGLGFSSTQRNELIVKVKGTTQRVLKIKF